MPWALHSLWCGHLIWVNDSFSLPLMSEVTVNGDCNARQIGHSSHFSSACISALTRYSIPAHEEYTFHAQLCVGRILTIWKERPENRPDILAITPIAPMMVPARQFAQWEGW
jgi:hypothetical protein